MDYRKEVERIRQREEQQRLGAAQSQAYVTNAKTKKKSKKLILIVLFFGLALIFTIGTLKLLNSNGGREELIKHLKKGSTTEQMNDAQEEPEQESLMEKENKEKDENKEGEVPEGESAGNEKNNEGSATKPSTPTEPSSEGSSIGSTEKRLKHNPAKASDSGYVDAQPD